MPSLMLTFGMAEGSELDVGHSAPPTTVSCPPFFPFFFFSLLPSLYLYNTHWPHWDQVPTQDIPLRVSQ